MARNFSDTKLLPNASEWDLKHHLPKDIIKESAELGFAAMYTSPDFGGCGMTRSDAALVFQALSTGCVTTSAYISIHNMNCWVIDTFGNEE